MRTDTYPAILAAIAATIVPAMASADTQAGLLPLSGSAQTAPPVRSTCNHPNVLARLAMAAPIEMPRILQDLGGPHGSISFAVTLAPDGTLLKTTILHSSGNRRLDENGLDAIRASKFTPEQRSCGNVGGTYEVDADLDV